jgi:hypothetical protein
MLRAENAFFNISKNPLLAWLFKKTFYAQFCAGENGHEVQRKLAEIKEMGYEGVILEFALEVLAGQDATTESPETQQAIEKWRKGILKSIQLAAPGDFVGHKYVF